MILFENDRMICFTYGSLIVWVFLLSVRLISIMAVLNIYKLPFDDRWRFEWAAQNKAPLRRYISHILLFTFQWFSLICCLSFLCMKLYEYIPNEIVYSLCCFQYTTWTRAKMLVEKNHCKFFLKKALIYFVRFSFIVVGQIVQCHHFVLCANVR